MRVALLLPLVASLLVAVSAQDATEQDVIDAHAITDPLITALSDLQIAHTDAYKNFRTTSFRPIEFGLVIQATTVQGDRDAIVGALDFGATTAGTALGNVESATIALAGATDLITNLNSIILDIQTILSNIIVTTPPANVEIQRIDALIVPIRTGLQNDDRQMESADNTLEDIRDVVNEDIPLVLTGVNEEIATLQEKLVEVLDVLVATVNETSLGIVAEVGALAGNIESVDANVTIAIADVATLSTQIAAIDTALDTTVAGLASVVTIASGITSQLNTSLVGIAQATADVDTIITQFETASTALASLSSAVISLTDNVDSVVTEVNGVIDAINDAAAGVMEGSANVTAAGDLLGDLTTDVGTASTEVLEVGTKLDTLNSTLAAASDSVAALGAQIAEDASLPSNLSSTAMVIGMTTVAAVSANVTALEASVSAVESDTVSATDAMIDMTDSAITALLGSVDGLDTAVQGIGAAVDAADGGLDSLDSALDSHIADTATAQTAADAIAAAVTTTDGKVMTAATAIDSLETKLTTAISDVEALQAAASTASTASIGECVGTIAGERAQVAESAAALAAAVAPSFSGFGASLLTILQQLQAARGVTGANALSGSTIDADPAASGSVSATPAATLNDIMAGLNNLLAAEHKRSAKLSLVAQADSVSTQQQALDDKVAATTVKVDGLEQKLDTVLASLSSVFAA